MYTVLSWLSFEETGVAADSHGACRFSQQCAHVDDSAMLVGWEVAQVFQVCADALTGVFKVTSIWHRFQPVQLVLFDTRPFLTRDSPLRLAAMSCSTAAMVGRGGGTGGWGGLTQLAKFSQCHHRFGSCARTQGAEQHGS